MGVQGDWSSWQVSLSLAKAGAIALAGAGAAPREQAKPASNMHSAPQEALANTIKAPTKIDFPKSKEGDILTQDSKQTQTNAPLDRHFAATDRLLLAGMILPLLVGMALKALFVPAAEGIEISGAYIFLTVKLPLLGDWPITETQVNSWLVMVTILFFCLWLTHGLKPEGGTKRQHVAEWIVEQTDSLVMENMGAYFKNFSPFIGAVLALSAFSSLITLVGLYPPTSDINVTAGWAILVFFLITYYKMKCGPLHYLKSFGEPVAFLTPLNVISEFATPVSMAFRHYGNILSGTVISVLMAAALQGLTQLLLGWLPGFLGEFPFFRIGLPAVLSIYFDLFSGCLQAFIFAMLTMLYVAGGFPEEDYKKKQAKKNKKKLKAALSTERFQ